MSQSQSYGDVTIAFDANFDTHVATVGPSTIELDRVNTVIVDDVDADWRITTTRWSNPEVPRVGDWNLALASRSRQLLRDLRCDVPMPAPPPLPQVPSSPSATG